MPRLLLSTLVYWLLCCLLMGSSTQAQTPWEKQFEKGVQAFEQGKHAKAERFFDKVLAAEPSYAPAYCWKGKCLQIFEAYTEAYEAFTAACNLMPEEASFWLERAQFKSYLGQLSIQKPSLCGSCGKQILPEASSFTAQDYDKSAIKDLQQAVLLDPNHAEAFYQLAQTQWRLQDKTAACEAYQKAKDLGQANTHQTLETACQP